MYRVCCVQAVHLVTYEWCQSVLNPMRRYSPPAHALSGALAGALAAAATTPLDVCKTLLNTQVTHFINFNCTENNCDISRMYVDFRSAFRCVATFIFTMSSFIFQCLF